MKTLSEILDFIGRERLMAEVGVKSSAVRMAEKSGKAPALWYDAMERLAGRPLPRDLFTFKAVKHDA